ncbi:M14 family metallopeptidase [Microbacterium esteraromaticum]|uniref:M14 family metallopeptidase n=1 Tax=Microbacterium esteraromaticum TaxID=57043 RepID=UPI0030B2BFFE
MLPVGVKKLGSFKGDKGNKGDTGSLAFATAESVPANEAATVEMVGPESNRGAHFKVPRGLPGTNAAANDEAFATYLGAPDSQTRGALVPAVAGIAFPHGGLLPRALDIWDAFDGTGLTYASWIAGIDADLLPLGVDKANLGASSDASRNMYAYTGGASQGLHMLLVSGTHGNEKLSLWSAREWFHKFLTSDDPTMQTLRSMLRVTWIPALNPAGFMATRENANGVDLNRNYDYFWASAVDKSGGTPFSQPETTAVKALLDAYPIAAVIDCHTIAQAVSPGTEADRAIQFMPPSPMVAGNRGLSYTAADQWVQLYKPDGKWFDLGWINYSLRPSLVSWAEMYMRYRKIRYNAAAITVEVPEQWAGSTSWDNVSREAVRRYCGYLTAWVVQWLVEGQRQPSSRAYTWHALRSPATAQESTAVSAGGSLLTGTTAGDIAWVTRDGIDVSAVKPTGLDVPCPSPGSFLIEFDGYIEAWAGAAGGRVVVSLMWGNADGAQTEVADSVVSIDLPTTAGKRVSFSGSTRVFGSFAGDIGKNLKRAKLRFTPYLGASENAVVRKATLRITHIANDIVADQTDGPDPLPVVRVG